MQFTRWCLNTTLIVYSVWIYQVHLTVKINICGSLYVPRLALGACQLKVASDILSTTLALDINSTRRPFLVVLNRAFRGETIVPWPLTGSEFHKVGAATEHALVPTFVLTLGTKSRLE